MTDLSRSCFALNKLNFSRCKALYKKKKRKETGYILKIEHRASQPGVCWTDAGGGVTFGFKWKENEKPDEAGRPHPLHSALLSALLRVSPRSGSPGTSSGESWRNRHCCASCSDRKAAFVATPSEPLGFSHTSESAPRLRSSSGKPKSTSTPKQLFPREGEAGRHGTRPAARLLNSRPDHVALHL